MQKIKPNDGKTLASGSTDKTIKLNVYRVRRYDEEY
jgi:hypothetical protein